ncbi:MAG: PASTA domain-containing protein [Prevotella sp.]|nr:PASTA domain-containing protein [Prevotella sp.]
MSKFNHKKILPRYKIIAYCIVLISIAVLAKAAYIGTVKRDYWMKVASRLKKDSVDVKPVRGNILSSDGQLMASSLPEYKMYIDFLAGGEKKDSLLMEKMDSICEGLHEIFPEQSAAQFRKNLEDGRAKKARHWAIWKYRVDYNTYARVKQLPVFNLSANKGGFHQEEFNARQHPFTSLASRTVGDLYGAKDSARYGLELSFDSVLRGEIGKMEKRMVKRRFIGLTQKEAVDGSDIVTTIDVQMQDIAERAVIDELKEINAQVGVAIVMDVPTGDIKAIVNMTKCADGQYREVKNNAVSDLLEPGSVFKTASVMVALDDGVVDTTKLINTGSGIVDMHGAKMKDHNWHKGGYGTISFARALEVSSNIGISRVIDEYYSKNPEKYVQGLQRIGIASDLNIPLVGASPPRIRMPKKNEKGQYINWSKTALPWMSIGYETQIPPISTLTFYNAIANGGKMMRPRFVKAVERDGEVIRTFDPVVLRPQICSANTLTKVRTLLEHVVSRGTGKAAKSQLFKVAGKTGTAQISHGISGYKSGAMKYLLSFVGFFPADNPRYSCIVCIQKVGHPASGGMSAKVFHNISEGIMAKDLKLNASDSQDSLSILMPDVKNGNMLAASYVLNHLGIATNTSWDGSYAHGNPIWGAATRTKNNIEMTESPKYADDVVPDVTGMGARDAVFLLEKRGVKVTLVGRGKVSSQSLPAGHKIKKGEACVLRMS